MGITQVENTCKRLSNPHQLFFSILLQAVFPLLKLLFSIPFFFFFVIYNVSSIKKTRMHACAIRVICLYNILKEITCKRRIFNICCRRKRSKYVPLTHIGAFHRQEMPLPR